MATAKKRKSKSKEKPKENRTLNEVLSISFVIILLVSILAFLQYSENGEENVSINNKEKLLTEDEMLVLANKSIEVIRFYSKSGEIIDGPRQVTQEDRNKIKALFLGLDDPIYIIQMRNNEKDLFVIMNNTYVIKTVPITTFDFG